MSIRTGRDVNRRKRNETRPKKARGLHSTATVSSSYQQCAGCTTNCLGRWQDMFASVYNRAPQEYVVGVCRVLRIRTLALAWVDQI